MEEGREQWRWFWREFWLLASSVGAELELSVRELCQNPSLAGVEA